MQKLRRKTVIMFIVLVLSVSLLPVYTYASAEDYLIDFAALEAIEGDAFYGPEDDMGFGGGYVGFLTAGKVWKLGTLDLSRYSAVEITYGSDGGALFADGSSTYIALTENGATQNSDYAPKEDARIIARTEQLAAPVGSWGAGKRTVTLDLDSVYNGEVWLTYNMEQIGAREDGIVVSGVRFVSKTIPDTTPNTDTSDTRIILLGAFLFLQLVTVIRKLEIRNQRRRLY